MNIDFQTKKLKEVSKITYGYTDSASSKNVGPKFLRITDIQSHSVSWGDVPYCNCSNLELSKYMLSEGDIVFARTGATTGKSFLIRNPPTAIFASYLIRLRLLSGSNLLPEFIALYFQTSNYWNAINSGLSGSAQGGFNATKLGELKIPVPPYSEQKRIVKILGEAIAAINKAKSNIEKNLRNSEELFDTYLNCIFRNTGNEWIEKPLSELCSISSTLVDPRKTEYTNFIHVGAGNIESKTGILSELKTAGEEKLISGKFLFDESMVLYSKIRPYLVKVVRCEFKGLCSADIYPLLANDRLVSKEFIYYILLTRQFTEYAIKGSQRAGMPKVNREHLFSYKLPIPPIDTQREIVAKLDALWVRTQGLIKIYQKKLSHLDYLKQSILQKAFSGQLTTSPKTLIT